MNISPVGFILFIVAVSGAIAYYADHLGKKIGKKRLHFGNLRPRHVASIGTVLLGVTVSLISILLAMLLSRDLRTVLLQGQELIRQKDAAEQQLGGLKKDVEDAKSVNVKLGNEGNKLEIQNRAKSLALRDKERLLNDRQKQIIDLNRKFAALQRQAAGYQAQLRDNKTELTKTNSSLNARQTELLTKTEELRTVNNELASVKDKLKSGLMQLKVAVNEHNEVAQQNLRLETEKEQLERAVSGLQTSITGLKDDRDRLTLQRDQAQKAYEESKQKLDEADAQLKSAQSDIAILNQAFTDIGNVSRYAPITYAWHDEVARLPLEPGLSYENSRLALTSLIRSARLAAMERGAKANGSIPAAAIVDHEDLKTKQPVTAAEIESNITRSIAGSKTPLVLVAYASVNTFRGEPVSLDVVAFANPIVYRKGQIVAESKIDGSKSDPEVFRQLSEFFAKQVRGNAIRAKMIPRSGSDRSLGELSVDEILGLVHQIRGQDRGIRLVAMADEETRAADTLKLNFRIR